MAGHAAPPPGQLAAAICVLLFMQLAARQDVAAGYFWHMPVPSQTPLFPQVDWAVAAHIAPSVAAWGSDIPAGTGVHMPGEVPLHV
jgi:hypothetical protein